MKTSQSKIGKKGILSVLVIAALGAGLAGISLSRSSTGPAKNAPAAVQAREGSSSQGAVAEVAPDHGAARPAPALPARQWKLGDSFVYQVDSTRQISVSQPVHVPSPAGHGG